MFLGLLALLLGYFLDLQELLIFSQFYVIFLSYTKAKRFLSFHSLFSISYFIVNWQVFLGAEILGRKLPDYMVQWYGVNSTVFLLSAYISTFAYYIYLLTYSKTFFNVYGKKKITELSLSGFNQFVIICSFSYVLYLIFGTSYRSSIYGYGTTGVLENYTRFGFMNIFYTCIIVNGYRLRYHLEIDTFKKLVLNTPVILLCIVIFHSLMLFAQGDRGNLITLWMLFLAPLFFGSLKFSKIRILLYSSLGLFFANLMKSFRTKEPLSFDLPENTFILNIVYDNFLELALSGRILNHAIFSVAESGYFLGWFQLKHLISSLPGLSGLFNRLFQVPSYLDSSADYMSYVIQEGKVLYGDGTSLLADFYLDFGLLGVVVGMIAVGKLASYVDQVLILKRNVNLTSWIVVLIGISSSFYMPRGSLGFLIQLIFPIYLLTRYIIRRC